MAKIDNIDLGEFPLLLAPMEDVSDPPFRALCKENGADVVYTEFISSEGLIRNAAKSAFSQNKKPKRLYKEFNQFGTKDSGYKYYSSGGNVFKGR